MSVNNLPAAKSDRTAAGFLARLGRDRSANSLIEFAYALPVFLTLGMYGIELANMAVVNMQVSQVAMALADNASRLGQAENSVVTPPVTNADVDSVMSGAMKQGASIDFTTNGRVILSSLQVDSTTGRQFIMWQKCRGSLVHTSNYGPKNYGLTGTAITGLGKTGQVTANANSAVMFVEAYYNYKPLFGNMFVNATQFGQEGAFIIRDKRDLTAASAPPAGMNDC